MRRFTATVASQRAYGLAEGPLWDPPRERLLWVDINAGDVHAGTIHDGTLHANPDALLHLDETVGAVACSDAGELLVAGRRSLFRIGPDGRPALHVELISAAQHSRLNDGACDPAGRFLVGSMALDDRHGEELLYAVDRDGNVAVVDDELSLSNGLAWSADGTVLYSVDSTPGIVWARDYDVAGPTWGPRAVALRVDDGVPDGLCLDADGNLWIAIHGAGEVRCHAPGGECLAIVSVPAPHTTSVAFVGPDRDRLLITTAHDGLSPLLRDRFPLSGHLFLADVGVTGLPTTPW